MNIRTLTVELLRAGQRHNQLLSPLTQYLGVCEDAPAGTVTVPYEQRDFETRLHELSYAVSAPDQSARRLMMIDKTGQEIADLLARIPGVPGALTTKLEAADTLTQLRIVISASELAMLPFELCQVPTGAGSPGSWLALQARTPVCITRHIRSVSAEGIRWPTDPRLLFIVGPETPFAEHYEALAQALVPWGGVDARPNRLVTLQHATLPDIVREVESAARSAMPFTHVHVLAHGAPLDDADRYSPIGVALHDQVVSGKALATALASMTDKAICRPAVVTLATCESGRVPDLRTPDASVAHDLHDQGIPLVVASQFPLSVEGSIPFVAQFYEGQLWGEHPLVSMYQVRLRLHSLLGHDVHDWASLVVYEAFPSDLPAQLEELRYWQTRRAQDFALKGVETFAGAAAEQLGSGDGKPPSDAALTDLEDRHERLAELAAGMGARLPTHGSYALECAGLRAAGHKRIAIAAFQLAVAPAVPEEWRQTLFADCLRLLEEARSEYWRATKSYLASMSDPMRKKVNLHWLLGQVLSLDVVLGRPLDVTSWTTAKFAAQIDIDSQNENVRAWAHVSLSELMLLRLADEQLSVADRAEVAEQVSSNIARVVELLGRSSEHITTTRRQFERYVNTWGDRDLQPALERLGVPDRQHWHAEHGLVPTAHAALALMRAPRPGRPRGGKTAGGRSGETRRPAPAGAATDPPTAAPPATIAPSADPPAAEPPAAGVVTPLAVLASPPSRREATSSAAIFDVDMLPAENGDCLWIEYGDPERPHRILVDCGATATARCVAARVAALDSGEEPPFELFVLTHIDADHINGVVPLFSQPAMGDRFRDIWFNGWRQINPFLSVKQGEEFSQILGNPARPLPWNRAMSAAGALVPAPIVIAGDGPLPAVELAGGLRLTLLSPREPELKRLGRDWKRALEELQPPRQMLGRKLPPAPVEDFARFDVAAVAGAPEKPDRSVPNGSSIALLCEFDGRAILLSGDAHADVLLASIHALQRERGQEGSKLKLDAFKLSHHGSANGTTAALIGAIDCQRYLVSTNGNIFYHPDREAIARVIVHGGDDPVLAFNYRSPYNGLWEEPTLRSRYHYRTLYPSQGTEGLRVSL